MNRWICLVPLCLAACDAPLQEIWPPERHALVHEGRAMTAKAQYDPIEAAWFIDITDPDGGLDEADRTQAIGAVEQQLGAAVCESGRMVYTPGQIWSGGGYARYNESLRAWRILANCA